MAEAENRVDPELTRFIQTHLPSVEHLEVLLLVGSSPEHWWTVRALNDLLRSREDSIKQRLKELCDGGLIEKAATEDTFRLSENPQFQGLVERLRAAYKTFRVRIIETIYTPKSSPITEFSRAFDFKEGKNQ